MIFSDIGQAFDNLRAQKTRTLLTALGIVFGVGSVIGMLAIGAGAAKNLCASSSNSACATSWWNRVRPPARRNCSSVAAIRRA